MVKIVIAAASSQLANEIIDKLVETKKHKIIGLVRKDPSAYRSLPGVTWVQTDYQDKAELVRLLQGVETVFSFFPVHFDKGNAIQKRLIDASVEAGVKRFAPSEWATGVKLANATDAMPWYAGKLEVAEYLEQINKDKKVLEYSRFQIGAFMNYLAHPHKTTNHVSGLTFAFDFSRQKAVAIEGFEDAVLTWTSVQDIAGVVARAVEYEGEWPAVGGISGSPMTIGQMLKLGESIGKPFEVEWLKLQDLEAELQAPQPADADLDIHNSSPEKLDAFLKWATRAILVAVTRGAYHISDEWNKLLPDYKFTQVEDLVREHWA
ncbi:hypothetical protein N3K66_007793 [Trichothecium roseum]|uniref:Uncharacterized protein n=1 Tax=Trichothecium roseum TaxID=47278 RepID=A0ACC0URL9_9HYPO|nr:hypothetical protein N3K66_007793 [Trichothecium roseum]